MRSVRKVFEFVEWGLVSKPDICHSFPCSCSSELQLKTGVGKERTDHVVMVLGAAGPAGAEEGAEAAGGLPWRHPNAIQRGAGSRASLCVPLHPNPGCQRQVKAGSCSLLL